jgi:uncharacterized membrane protein
MNVLLAASNSWSPGDALLLAIEIFFMVLWIFIFVSIIMDVFRDHEIGGWHKAAWLLFLIVVPFFSALIYLIVRGGGMRDRSIQQAIDMQNAQNAYIKEVAGSSVDDLAKLHDLKEKGVISQEEFDAAKAKALA